MRNDSLQFRCEWVHLRTETARFAVHRCLRPGSVLRIPISHGEGNYFADQATLDELAQSDRVAFRYCDAAGDVTPAANPNGLVQNIAGILNARAQRARDDAAPGAGRRGAAWRRRRAAALALADRIVCAEPLMYYGAAPMYGLRPRLSRAGLVPFPVYYDVPAPERPLRRLRTAFRLVLLVPAFAVCGVLRRDR